MLLPLCPGKQSCARGKQRRAEQPVLLRQGAQAWLIPPECSAEGSVPLADTQGACPAFLWAWSELLPRLLLQEQGTGWMGLVSIRSKWDKQTHSRHSRAEGNGPGLQDSTYSTGCGNFLGSIQVVFLETSFCGLFSQAHTQEEVKSSNPGFVLMVFY